MPRGSRGSPSAGGSGPQQACHVAPLPGHRALEVPEVALALLELGRMEVHTAEAAARRDHVVEHLVVDDVLNEVPGDPLLVERRVDADHAVDRAVAPELDGL